MKTQPLWTLAVSKVAAKMAKNVSVGAQVVKILYTVGITGILWMLLELHIAIIAGWVLGGSSHES